MLNRFRIGTILMLASIILGCTTTDPYTGQSRYDPDATAALVGGLAVAGLAAYAASSDDDEDRHEHHRHHRDHQHGHHHGDGSFSPHRHVKCYDYQRVCYRRGHYSKKWTRERYGDQYW